MKNRDSPQWPDSDGITKLRGKEVKEPKPATFTKGSGDGINSTEKI